MKSIGNKLREVLCDHRGSGTLTWTLIWVIVILMLLSVMMTFFQGYVVIRGVREAIINCSITTSAERAYDAYAGLRDSNSSLHRYDLSLEEWSENYTLSGPSGLRATNDIYRQMCERFDCVREGDTLVRYLEDSPTGYEYKLRDIQLSITNPEYNYTGSDPVSFTITVDYVLEIPMVYIGEIPITVSLNQTAKSIWKPHFG